MAWNKGESRDAGAALQMGVTNRVVGRKRKIVGGGCGKGTVDKARTKRGVKRETDR